MNIACKTCNCPKQNCCICKKEIIDCEYVVNWGGCSDCFDKNYQNYLMNQSKIEKIEDYYIYTDQNVDK